MLSGWLLGCIEMFWLLSDNMVEDVDFVFLIESWIVFDGVNVIQCVWCVFMILVLEDCFIIGLFLMSV